ncbi:MAG: RNA polymerase sigma-70 factor [Bacteroidota bacterium]|nr:RNA polymerase sigma-70 factor [Bacteroidota bacterium]
MNVPKEMTLQNFRLFFDQNYQKLCSYAFQFLKDRESCEDLVQDTFIKVWENRQDLIGSDQLKFYMFSAVRNNCLTRLQKIRKYRETEIREDTGIGEIIEKLEAEEPSSEPAAMVARALERLPPKCREVFLMSRIENLSYQQIAQSLGISVKTVENQMGKAIKILRVFARDNRIYLIVTFCILTIKYLAPHMGVLLKNLFY